MNLIIEKEKWSSFSKKIPMIGVVGLMGEWMTIYACMQQAIKNFDNIIVVGDGASEKAKQKFEQFLSDYQIQCQGRVSFFELDKVDPWPWLVFPRDNETYSSIEDVPVKSWSKAGFKRFNLARSLFPNSLLFSVHSDVVVFSDSRLRMQERLSNIENPLFDSEWFSMVTAWDLENVASILDPTASPGNLIGHRSLSQRTVYDYPGDWGLMGYYASSMLSVGPDPQGPAAECFYPWSRKTQCQKKGFDTNEPYAIHFEFLRDKNIDRDCSQHMWKMINPSKGCSRDGKFKVNMDYNLIERMKFIKDNCYFPVKFNIEETGILRIVNT